ncbi:hypothetical protein CMV_018752 [Castanea mollissima]|uniref:non-specific serine/threonine protein kinase n=1 Tax=Castanea mollissima TaxID=60419 RepID=A0A8J4VC97_9ROSI|nr:hypothetical protein CMV_018752 [Castanea mollissima]
MIELDPNDCVISVCESAESKSTNDTSQDQPVAPVVSSSTTSIAESTPSTPNLVEELKVASQLRKFDVNELKSSTRNFRPETLLGEGGFGCVFKGWINENRTAPVKPGTGVAVAVKTLNQDGLQGHKEWLAEVNYLGGLLHPNLVKLIGYCIEDDQRLLVYEFMPRVSLENNLFRRSLPLPWSIRMKVALGAAKGLAFLHEEAEKPVIYRDFKTSNILLDADYNAKLSDFGLAKDDPEDGKTRVSTRVMGTYSYAAPEYVMTGRLHHSFRLYMQAERMGSYPNARNCSRIQTGFSRNGQPTRSLSIPNGPHVSPYHHHHLHCSPKPRAPSSQTIKSRQQPSDCPGENHEAALIWKEYYSKLLCSVEF